MNTQNTATRTPATAPAVPGVVARLDLKTFWYDHTFDDGDTIALHSDEHTLQDFPDVCADILAGRGVAAGAQWITVHFAWAELVDAAGRRWGWVCPERGGVWNDFGFPSGGPDDPTLGYCPDCFSQNPEACEGLGGCWMEVA